MSPAGCPPPSIYAHTGASSCSRQGTCVGSHMCTDTHRHVGAYTVCSVCRHVHPQRQAGLRVLPCAYSWSREHRVLHTHVDFWSHMVRHLYKAWCTPTWRGVHTFIGHTHREGMSESPQTLPRSGQPQRLLGRQACSWRAGGASSPLLCFLPSRALRPLPRHLRQSAKAAAARPGPPHPVRLTSLPLIHCQPWLTGKGRGRGWGPGWLCSDPFPLAQGPPSRCSMGPSWPLMRTWTSTPWSPTSC